MKQLSAAAIVALLSSACVGLEEELDEPEVGEEEQLLSFGVRLGEHHHFGGRNLYFTQTGCFNLTTYGFNDTVSSAANLGGGARVTLFEHTFCSGAQINIGWAPTLTGFWNDRASSVRIRDPR